MTPREALREGSASLAGSGGTDGSPALDASLLLAASLGIDRSRLFSLPEASLGEECLARYRELLAARAAGRPVAYLLGVKEFYGRPFRVDPRVLIPRPDTELLVEAALRAGDGIAQRVNAPGAGRPPAPLRVHECCVGSGAVAVSVAAERPAWEVSASDLSGSALGLARENAAALLDPARPGGPLRLAESDLLAAEPGPWDLILANPPYVGSAEARRLAEAWGEPRLALDGGEDGLDLCRRLAGEAAARLRPGGVLLVEADPGQAAALAALFRAAGLGEVETFADLGGRARVTSGRKPWTSSSGS